MHHYRLGAYWLESHFAEKDLRVLVYNKLTMGQQFALAAKTDSLHGFIRKRVANR